MPDVLRGNFGRVGPKPFFRPGDQVSAAIPNRPSGNTDKFRSAASDPPVLKRPDGIAEKIGRLLFTDQLIQNKGIGLGGCPLQHCLLLSSLNTKEALRSSAPQKTTQFDWTKLCFVRAHSERGARSLG